MTPTEYAEAFRNIRKEEEVWKYLNKYGDWKFNVSADNISLEDWTQYFMEKLKGEENHSPHMTGSRVSRRIRIIRDSERIKQNEVNTKKKANDLPRPSPSVESVGTPPASSRKDSDYVPTEKQRNILPESVDETKLDMDTLNEQKNKINLIRKAIGVSANDAEDEEIAKVWRKEMRIPKEWRTGTITPIDTMKGKQNDCGSYQKIVRFKTPYRIYANLLARRLQQEVEEKSILRDIGAEFRGEQSPFNYSYTLYRLIEHSLCNNEDAVHALRVDFKKELCHSIDRETLWEVLLKYNVSVQLVERIEDAYDKIRYAVKVNGNEGENFWPSTGLWEECPMTPILIAIYMTDLEDEMETSMKVYIQETMTNFTAKDIRSYEDYLVQKAMKTFLTHREEEVASIISSSGLEIFISNPSNFK